MSLPSIFGLLNLNQRSMFASQLGVQVANHNIANVNTPGYVRQELLLQPSRSLATGVGDIGMGVQLEQIRRVNDGFLQAAFYKENAEYSEWSGAANILDRVEILTGIDEPGSLSTAITEFFNSFKQLASNTEDASVRTIVVNAGTTLAERFHAFSRGLDDLESEIGAKVTHESEKVTAILAEISELNKQVISKDTHEVKSNDLKVRREQLLEDLSGLVRFSVSEDSFGATDVYIAGRNVVHRDSYVTVAPDEGGSSAGATMQIEIDGVYLAADRIGGSLGALIETRDVELKSVRDALNSLAETVIDRVNDLHSRGFSPAGGGIQFFDGSSAESIEVYSVLRNDPQYVAHSYNNTPGDNSLANDLAALGETSLVELGGRSILGYFSSFVGDVGSLSKTAKGMVENKALTRSEVQSRIESVAGVSIDEEVANVTRFQTMYEASARMIGVVNGMLDTLISLGNER